MSTAKPKTQHSSQQKAFIEAARSLGCDDDEEAFDKRLKAVASAPPPTPAKKPKTKKPAK
jgi:hypothetical protein